MRVFRSLLLVCASVACAQAQYYPAGGGFPPAAVTVMYPQPQVAVIVLDSPPPPVAHVALSLQAFPLSLVGPYLIAFKDSVVRLADDYWVDGGTLYYVTAGHERRSAPVASVERALSVQLNLQRNVVFTLPPETRALVVHHTAVGSASRRKACTCR
jgi:hypothetical protein